MWFSLFDWKKKGTAHWQAPTTFHHHDIVPPLLAHSCPANSMLACLMVMEAWHREGSGKSFNSVTQIGNASHSLWVLKEEVLEVLELGWTIQQRRERGKAQLSNFFVLSPLGFCFVSYFRIQQFNITYRSLYFLRVAYCYKVKDKKVRHMFLSNAGLCCNLSPFLQ